MPRSTVVKSKPSVIHQTIEIPTPTNGDGKPEIEEKPDFWAYMQSLSPEQWKDHIVYLTRENPKTSINGVGGYLTKLQQPFDIEDIKVAYGGYEFSYIMKKKNEIAHSGRFRVEAPPKFDATRESAPTAAQPAADTATTASLINQFISVLRDELARSREQSPSTANEEAIKLLTNASNRAMEVIMKQVPQTTDPTQQLTQMLALLEKFRPQQPAPSSDLLALILPELVKKLMTPVDPFAQITTFLAVFEKIDALRGSGGEGKPKDWKAAAVDHLPEILSTAKEMLQSNAEAAKERRAGLEAQRATAETLRHLPQNPTAQPPATQVAAPVQPTSGQQPSRRAFDEQVVATEGLRTVPLNTAPASDARPATTGEIDTDSNEFLNFVKRRVVELIHTGSSGESIVDFLDGVKPEFSQQLVQYPAEMVTSFFRADPILARAVANPRWNEVLEQARAYILENEEAPVAAPAPN